MSAADFKTEAKEFFDASDFAESGTIAGVAVVVIPDSEFEEVAGHEANPPMATVYTDGVTITHGMTYTDSRGSYTIREVHDDGTGVAVLMLEKQ